MTIPSVAQIVRIADITVNERGSAYVQGTIVDETGEPVPLASVEAFALTLFNDADEQIINSRNAQSILNEHGGTYHATSGAFTLMLSTDDNPIIDTTLARGVKETHTARLTLTWANGGRWDGEVRLRVRNLALVP
jgi:hypothetical protein